jgi:putative DNA primase/helicase
MSADSKKVVPIKPDSSIREAVAARVAEEQEKFGSGGGDSPISSKFVLECLNANEFGDGLLFVALHRGLFVYNSSSKEWFCWCGHNWELDILGEHKAAVETVARRYLEELIPLGKDLAQAFADDNKSRQKELLDLQTSIRNRVNRLRSDRGRANALKFAAESTESLGIKGEIMDQNPWLFPCANGVIDLRTGLLHPGRPDDYMVKASPVEFTGIEADRSLWIQTLLEIYDGNQELVDFLQRLFGFAMTGLSRPAIFPVFHGKGRNGKSLIFDVITAIMGPLAAPIQSELFLDQGKNSSRNPSAPSPEIMALKGLRLAVGSETDDGRRVSASRVKWLTGNDTLVGRNPNDKYQVSFRPTHTLALLTNHKPQAPADDFAFWERCKLIAHTISFVDREPTSPNERWADLNLLEKLLAMLPGILGWMVEGCLIWQREGLNPPAVVTEATAEYQKAEDFIGQFLDDRCDLGPDYSVGATKLYDEFKDWWLDTMSKNEKSVPAQKRFGGWIGSRTDIEKRKASGTYKYFGLRLKEESAS